jgi:hypothetical protein
MTRELTILPNDTIKFLANELYITNGGTEKDFTLFSVTDKNNIKLTLYYYSTLGGSFSGKVTSSFVSDGQISNANFLVVFNGNNEIRV